MDIEGGVLKRNVKIHLDPSKSYSSYLRLILPKDAGVSPFKLSSENKTVKPEVYAGNGQKEAGTMLNLKAGVPLDVEVSWESSLGEGSTPKNKIVSTIYSQSGYVVPLTLNINSQKANVELTSGDFLTSGQMISYNTTLSDNIQTQLKIIN